MHAVFVTLQDFDRLRVTAWTNWDVAQDEWTRLDDRRRAGELPHVRFFEVRSSDDPNYNRSPFEPFLSLPPAERPQWVTLTKGERHDLLALGRKAGNLEDAASAMFSELASSYRWEHLPAVDISDYTWAAARFCFPREAETW